MGYMEGLLTGFMGRKSEVEAENIRNAELAAARESEVYKALLGSENPEIQAMATAGLLESASPKKRKGGLKGWLGEMESSPTFSKLLSYLNTPQPVADEMETLPSKHLTDMRATGMPQVLPGQTVQPVAYDIPASQGAASQPDASPVQPGGGAPPQPMAYTQAPPQPYSMQTGRTALPQVFLTPEQRMRRDVRIKAEQEGLEITAKQEAFYKAARRYMTHEEAMKYSLEQIGHSPRSGSGASGLRFGGTLKGDMVPAGQMDTFGQPVKPEQWYRTQIQPDGRLLYVPTVAPSGPSAGVEYNRAAIQMGYARPADVPMERRAELEDNAEKLARELRYETGMGAGKAQIETELNMPIGATAAIQYGVPPTTTLKQLSETVGLSPEQKQRVYTLGQVDVLIADIDRLIPEVFPAVPEGIKGRVKTQLSLGMQKFSADADFAALEASINGALAQIAQLSGQPGSRLSDRDIDIARSQLLGLTPSMFGGDTINTAKARMNIVKSLLEKARGAIPTPTLGAAPGSTPGPARTEPPPTPATAAPTAVKDSNGNWVIRVP